jgi:hypothetical protein
MHMQRLAIEIPIHARLLADQQLSKRKKAATKAS